MQEAFLHFLWRYRRFDHKHLLTTEGESLTIIEVGAYNLDSGPDFFNAKIRLNDTIWVGNIEIHVYASDWYRHQHEKDAAYNGVILHVVFNEDKVVVRHNKERIPCLELQARIKPSLYKTYKKLRTLEQPIACQKQVNRLSPTIVNLWLERMTVERLQRKVEKIEPMLSQHTYDWESVFAELLVANIGAPVNKLAFEQLARKVPLPLILRYRNRLVLLEALFFGQAGLLENEFIEDYPLLLQREYRYLSKLHLLEPMNKVQWKFSRMRPSNFPTLRIAQLARLFFQTEHLFSKTLALGEVKEAYQMFEVQLADYWKTHYRFGQTGANSIKRLGNSSIDLLLINVIVPILFLYGTERAMPRFKEKAMNLLVELKPENNRLIRNWSKIGISADSAAQTQALIHLYKNYCDKKRCLQCSIGAAILS